VAFGVLPACISFLIHRRARIQWDTRKFCNACDYNTTDTRQCNPNKCPILHMPPQYTAKVFDEDGDVVHFFITGGNENNGSVTMGQPAFRIDPNTGIIQVRCGSIHSFQRSFGLRSDLRVISPFSVVCRRLRSWTMRRGRSSSICEWILLTKAQSHRCTSGRPSFFTSQCWMRMIHQRLPAATTPQSMKTRP
jgi:hypothetical protein